MIDKNIAFIFFGYSVVSYLYVKDYDFNNVKENYLKMMTILIGLMFCSFRIYPLSYVMLFGLFIASITRYKKTNNNFKTNDKFLKEFDKIDLTYESRDNDIVPGETISMDITSSDS